MPVFSRAEVGPVAFERLLRDGVAVLVGPHHARPAGIPETPADRAATLAGFVLRHTVVSGLAALWIREGGPRPRVLTLVGRRGLHRTKPGKAPPGWTPAYHTGPTALEPSTVWAGVRVASEACARADAARWEGLSRDVGRR